MDEVSTAPRDAHASGVAKDADVTYRGTVKLFSLERGYGFIKCESISTDVYVTRVNIEKPKGFLRGGDLVEFHILRQKGQVPQAVRVRRLKEDGTEDDTASEVADTRAMSTVEAVLSKARMLALQAVGDQVATGDPEAEEKQRRMQECLRDIEAERQQRLSKMLSQAEEAKKQAMELEAEALESSDDDDDDPSLHPLSAPPLTNGGGLLDEKSIMAVMPIILQRQMGKRGPDGVAQCEAVEVKGKDGTTTTWDKEKIDADIARTSSAVRKYEVKLSNARRRLDDLKMMRSVMVGTTSNVTQAQMNMQVSKAINGPATPPTTRASSAPEAAELARRASAAPAAIAAATAAAVPSAATRVAATPVSAPASASASPRLGAVSTPRAVSTPKQDAASVPATPVKPPAPPSAASFLSGMKFDGGVMLDMDMSFLNEAEILRDVLSSVKPASSRAKGYSDAHDSNPTGDLSFDGDECVLP